MVRRWLGGLLLLLSVIGCPASESDDRAWLVRVGLERQAAGKEIFVQAQGGAFRWVDIDTGRTLAESSPDRLWRVVSDGDGFRAEPYGESTPPSPQRGEATPKKPSSPLGGESFVFRLALQRFDPLTRPLSPEERGRRFGSAGASPSKGVPLTLTLSPEGRGHRFGSAGASPSRGVPLTLTLSPEGRGDHVQVRARRLRAEPIGDALLAVGSRPDALKPYRGALEWQARGERLLTINHVRLDDYLKAVLPAEVPPRFHPEALKTQAVAARSFTLRRLNRHRDGGYDLCDTEHCQLYGGAAVEHPATSAAVEATVGEVLWHDGRVFEALYSGNCGGHTAPNEQVGFGSVALTPLQGTLDWDEQAGRYYCDIAPNARWSLTLTPEELKRAFPEAGNPKALRIEKRATSGHVAELTLEGDRATLQITGMLFRQRLGTTRIRSLLFTMEPEGNGWRIAGRGAGHGIGLCQWGAQGRALAGQDYRTILEAYYPSTTLGTLPAAPTASAPMTNEERGASAGGTPRLH